MAEYVVLVLPFVVPVIARLHATRSQSAILVGVLNGRLRKFVL